MFSFDSLNHKGSLLNCPREQPQNIKNIKKNIEANVDARRTNSIKRKKLYEIVSRSFSRMKFAAKFIKHINLGGY